MGIMFSLALKEKTRIPKGKGAPSESFSSTTGWRIQRKEQQNEFIRHPKLRENEKRNTRHTFAKIRDNFQMIAKVWTGRVSLFIFSCIFHIGISFLRLEDASREDETVICQTRPRNHE